MDVNTDNSFTPITAETFHSSAARVKPQGPPSNVTTDFKCIFCENDHKPQHCKAVTNLDARKEILREKRRCFRCLKLGHQSNQCVSRMKCFECSRFHHAAMCHKKLRPHVNDPPDNGKLTSFAGATSRQSVLLQTAKVFVRSSEHSPSQSCRLLFDNCSQLSYISPSLRNKLKLKTIETKQINIRTFGNQSVTETLDKVQFCVVGLDHSLITVSCFVKEICAPISNQEIEFAVKKYDHLKGLRLADCDAGNGVVQIDVLIGADLYWRFIDSDVVRGECGPVALSSKLGYILSGEVDGVVERSTCAVVSSHVLKVQSEIVDEKDSLRGSMRDLFDCNESEFDDGDMIFDEFRKSIRFDLTKRQYEVELPFKNNHPLISDNYSLCIKRLEALNKKFSKNNDLFTAYNDIVKNQLEAGIIEQVSNHSAVTGNVHYLPHRPIVREDKVTTKIRMVFDASARTYGPSLNECLSAGPSLTTSLFGVLLRFRVPRYVFIADIEKAFLQIFVRFLWYDDIYNLDANKLNDVKLATYRLCKVLFGVTSSPFLLSGTLLHHAEKYKDTDPAFVERLLQSLHVDDLNAGTNDIHEGIEFYNKCKFRLSEAGFNLRKFESNSPEMEHMIQEEHFTPHSNTKVLGLSWNKAEDTFKFSFTELLKLNIDVPTKRDILRFIASIYDPLGLINPVVVKFKMLFQKLCVGSFSWEDKLCGELLQEWNSLLNDISITNYLSVPRWCISSPFYSNAIKFELHGFSDASLKAYGCCIYLCSIFNDNHCSTSLITSKSRVAPLSKTTVPRLELRAMLLLADLMSIVQKELKSVLTFHDIVCWSDSTICLHWLNNSHKVYEPFVQNRLIKVRQLFNVNYWKYVDTNRNPADIISRGSSLCDLQGNTFWFNGPDFLNDLSLNRPSYDLNKVNDISSCIVSSTVNIYKFDLQFIDINNFSSFERLLRVTGFVLRFIKNLKLKRQKKEMMLTPVLSAVEIQDARNLWIQFIQKDVMDGRYYKQLKKDLRFRVVDGIIRCEGRLQNAPLNYNSKFPIFIPRDCRFANLIIVYFHRLVKHNGIKETLNELRTQFWIPKCRSLIRSLIQKCYLCKRFEGRPYSYPPAPALPPCRLNDDHAFKFTALDYAGPLYLKNVYGDGELNKAWIFLFTCSSSRSLVLDLVPDCSSLACIRGLRRFFSRRGVPTEILSDNGAQFKSEETQTFAASKTVKWRFNVAAAPWWGGLFERMVRSTKRCLKKVITNSRLTYEEVLTLLVEIEVVINNRPLTFVYDQPSDEPLTPNHLVFGRKLNLNGTLDDIPVETDVVVRNNHIEVVLEHFKRRWKNEYLIELREFHKAKKRCGSANISVGDIVHIEDEKTRALWKIGVIDSFIQSRDNQIRAATVRYMQSGKFRTVNRPINKLYPIEINKKKNDIVVPGACDLKIDFIDEKNICLLKTG